MRVPFVKCAVAVALGSMLLLGANGCAPSQVTHHSGQIGRYYGDGVFFSVPVVQIADEVQKEDKFWEVRQGIGGADVVVLGPFVTEGTDNYRENMALSSRSVSGVGNVEQLREVLINSLTEEVPSASGFVKGQNETNCWVDYTCTESEKELFCRAYFFYDSERSLGYTLVGTVLNSSKNDAVLRDFANVAETFRIGVPQSGFVYLSESLVGATALASTADAPAVEPTSEASPAPAVTPDAKGGPTLPSEPAASEPKAATTDNEQISPADGAAPVANPATPAVSGQVAPANSPDAPVTNGQTAATHGQDTPVAESAASVAGE